MELRICVGFTAQQRRTIAGPPVCMSAFPQNWINSAVKTKFERVFFRAPIPYALCHPIDTNLLRERLQTKLAAGSVKANAPPVKIERIAGLHAQTPPAREPLPLL